MHSIEEIGGNVPAFLAKLWKMVDDSETNDLICWNSNGSSFFIRDQSRFSRELLPLYYKHNNMASFVRQLNMYGFHKVVSIEGGGLKVEKNDMEFAHQYFLMGQPYLLSHIKRKIPVTKNEEGRTLPKLELLNKILVEVKNMKGCQASVNSQLTSLKQENEVLWREVALLRQKHAKQQQIVNKLIQFLMSMVHQTRSSSGIGLKRHYPLMLRDKSSVKSPKRNGDYLDRHSISSNSPSGPVIHEIDPSEMVDIHHTENNISHQIPSVSSVSDDAIITEESIIPEETVISDDSVVANETIIPDESILSSEAILVDDSILPDDAIIAEETLIPEELCTAVVEGDNSNLPDNLRKVQLPKDTEVFLNIPEGYTIQPNVVFTVPAAETLNINRKLKKTKNTKSSCGKSRKKKSKSVPENTVSMKKQPQSVDDILDAMAVGPGNSEKLDNIIDLDEAALDILNDDTENSLLLATDEAISAISKVAADSKKSETTGTSDNRTIAARNVLSNEMELSKAPSSELALACTKPSDKISINRCGNTKDQLDSHVDTIQKDLDNLRDLLTSVGDDYRVDANTVIGVCPYPRVVGLEQDFLLKLFGDDFLSYGISMFPEVDEKAKGNELMSYSPNQLDFSGLADSDDEWILPDLSSNEVMSALNTPQMNITNSPEIDRKPH